MEADGFSFIAVGRPEAAGCYCKVNLYLKEVISILADNFDYVVIDGEAGVEQINRRVMEKVTHLLLITDSSRKGTQVIRTIKKVADRVGSCTSRWELRQPAALYGCEQYLDMGRYPGAGLHPSDAALAEFDLKGENVFFLPKDAAIVRGAREALAKIGLLDGEH